MTVEQVVTEIMNLIDEMRDLTMGAGVPVKYYEHFAVFDGQATLEELRRFHSFLDEVRHKEYFGVLEIWRLLSPEVWQRYSDMGYAHLREQVLLRERRKVLKDTWRAYYKANHRGEEAVLTESERNPGTVDAQRV